MGIFKRKAKETQTDERRADDGTTSVDDVLLKALIGNATISREQAQNIPSVQSCINFVADIVSMLPVKLYSESEGKTTVIANDPRIRLLNSDTGDTLDAVQFWRAIVADYYLGKGGYAYIKRSKNDFSSLHYVDEKNVTINKNVDPIFKTYDIMVNAATYKPYDFLKILRNTKDGASGVGIVEESSLILSVAYNALVFEENLVKKGGNKKGFLQSQKKLAQEVIDKLKEAWRNLYSNNSDNVVVLNDGIEFKESSNTSVEMQLNENKESNSIEICKLFNLPASIIKGTASPQDYKNAFTMSVQPVLKAIQCALNRDFLLEKEKATKYWSFDTKEMLKGDIKERYEAYKMGIDANFLQIDEVRNVENLEPLDLNWIKLSLDSVLYNTKTKEIYTPNTNKSVKITDLKGGGNDES